jgi:hypothetical protein
MDDAEDRKKRGKKETMNEPTRSATVTSGKPPVYDMIGKRLRDYFDEVAKQPVPDRFLELLNQLDSKTSPKKES